MSKDKISDYSATANSNTDIGGVNIDEGCAPSGINDAIRTLMKQLKDFQQGTNGDSFNGPVGSTTRSTGAFTSISTTGDITIDNGAADGGQLLLASSGYSNWGIDNYSGNFRWYYNSSEKMRLDNSGNLGIGVSPSAWYVASANARTLQINRAGLYADTGNSVFLSSNYLFGTSGSETFIGSGYANKFLINSGQFRWLTSTASGAAGGDPATMTQAMTLDASGNLVVGDTTANRAGASHGISVNGTSSSVLETNYASARAGNIYSYASGTNIGEVRNLPLIFTTNDTERARIDSNGNLLVGKTSDVLGNTGALFDYRGSFTFTRSGASVGYINRLASDGTLLSFLQDTTEEGTISVSGTTVSYNGGHLARYAQTVGVKDESLVKGTVLSNLDEMNVYTDADENPVANEQLNKVKVSDVEGDANVAGVFVNWSHDEKHNVDEINMAMTGDMIIRIAQGTTVARGDLLMSAGDGTAKPQGDDIVRTKTIAKVTSNHVTCTYEDGSYCVPCVLMAC